MYTLVELCCGSSALTLKALGAKRSLVPYQGSKWKVSGRLLSLAASCGLVGVPDKVVLVDPGPWGVTMGVVLDPASRLEVIARLKVFDKLNPRHVFDKLHGGDVPDNATDFAAEHLFLQRLSFSGKAVTIESGRWVSPGFNKASAYGLPKTEVFGEVKPMVPSLIQALEGLNLSPAEVSCTMAKAASPTGPLNRPTLVYIDPPYANVTGYADKLTTSEVVALARAWRDAGATVMVSEAFGLKGLLTDDDLPWSTVMLTPAASNGSPFKSKREEWVTILSKRP